ncbi:hypothetical protein BDV98DRAFT_651787 [Pterulicium gracile]|uniref:Uncharacterized protein n=1 Tax=Pterulicium gracile TaxID=1884261 RepID=A0A5C3Q2A4_9AGAR|nr:hypothetical protein BDV98DRAFT_651787 [Pterula gracilis]
MLSNTSSESSSTTPMVLTPDSTGAGPGIPDMHPDELAGADAKKKRRQTAFYPNVNSSNKQEKPFSRSAAKRESVMALGSIEYLQHYFTKTGLAAKKSSLERPNRQLVPAIGPGVLTAAHIKGNPSLSDLPPSPAVPNAPPLAFLTPVVKTYEVDSVELLPGVIDDLERVARAWGIDSSPDSPSSASTTTTGRKEKMLGDDIHTVSGGVDVLALLKMTTTTIRSVRNYVLSLPDEGTTTSTPSGRGQKFRSKLFTSTSASTTAASTSPSSSNRPVHDPPAVVRKAALEALTVLRELEEKARLPLSDDAYDAQSDSGSASGQGSGFSTHNRVASPALSRTSSLRSPDPDFTPRPPSSAPSPDPDASMSMADTSLAYSFVSLPGSRTRAVPVWEDLDAAFANGWDDEVLATSGPAWDERLVLGSGWLYKQDIKAEELVKEKAAVKGYLSVVDGVLFSVTGEGGWGWDKVKEKLVSKLKAGMGTGDMRRVSAGDAGLRGQFVFPPPLAAQGRRPKRRVVSMDPAMGSPATSAGPGDMGSLREEGEEAEATQLGGVAEEDVSEDEEPPGGDMGGETPVVAYEDDDLPVWARRKWEGSELGRIHALLAAMLPLDLRDILPAPPSSDSTSSTLSPDPSSADPEAVRFRLALLSSLSSGQLLCVAYNACVRKSRRPWGYVNLDAVHDVLALERVAALKGDEKTAKGWTFRRVDNLQLWMGALKLRYQLPLVSPPSATSNSSSAFVGIGSIMATMRTPGTSMSGTPLPSPAHTMMRFAGEAPILFDARVVAKREEGWDGMLEGVVMAWVGRVVDEARGVVGR